MAFLSTISLGWVGLLTLAYSLLFLFKPDVILSGFYSTEVFVGSDPLLTNICRYFGASQLVHAAVFLHCIPNAEKHRQGLRLALMLSFVYILVALHRIVMEGSIIDNLARNAAVKTIAVQGFTFFLCFLGVHSCEAGKKKKA